MKMFFFLVIVLSVLTGCNSLEPTGSSDHFNTDLDSTKVLVRYHSESSKFGKIDRADLTKKFDDFYQDKNGRFFVKSLGHQRSRDHEIEPVDVFIEIPELDSASYVNLGSYMKDDSKVICVYKNSDGGNFVLLKDADPTTFQVFNNAFGGKDKGHVFYQANMLPGLDPLSVKVYSNTKNCPNCLAYFTDGKLCYWGVQKNELKDCVIPSEYKFVE